jgi:hypothetical protein
MLIKLQCTTTLLWLLTAPNVQRLTIDAVRQSMDGNAGCVANTVGCRSCTQRLHSLISAVARNQPCILVIWVVQRMPVPGLLVLIKS